VAGPQNSIAKFGVWEDAAQDDVKELGMECMDYVIYQQYAWHNGGLGY